MSSTPRRLPHFVFALFPVAALSVASCGGSDRGTTGPEPTATVRVEVTATGRFPDPDGFTVSLASMTRQVPAEGGTVVFEELEPGSHTVELGGVDTPCAVAGGPTTTVTAPADGVGEVVFDVECEAFQEVACPGLALEATSALPLDELTIGELPESLELPVAASMAVDGTGHDGFAFVTPVDAAPGETLRLLVPVHPTSPQQGGRVLLTFSDGTRACPPVELEVEGLPPAPGEMLAVVDGLQELLEDQADALGSTPEELVSAPVGELPLGLRPLAVAQRLLDGPGFEGSLRAVAQGSRGDEVTMLMDRLLARAGVRATLGEGGSASPAVGGAVVTAVDVSATQCLPSIVSDSEPSVLEACMRAAAEANRRASGAAAEVADDIQKVFSTAGELQIPAAGAAGVVFGSVFTVVKTMRERVAALYPSSFTSMDVEVSPESFKEDEDTKGRVISASATATNRGYDLWQEILTALNQGVSIAEATAGFDFSTGTDVDELAAELRPVMEDAIAGTEISALEIPPETFGPVELTDPQWVKVTVPVGNAVKVREGTLSYDPFVHGEATLSVRNRTEGGLFGGEQISEQKTVEVQTLQLQFTPDELFVPPRDPEGTTIVTLELNVSRSQHPDSVDLDRSNHPDQGTAAMRPTEGGSRHFVDYTPPADPDFDRADLLVAEHTARGGARANGPERVAIATIRFAELLINPRHGCVEAGDTLQFTADLEGLDDDRATWSTDLGTIDPESGLYQAPETPAPGATATIQAQSVPHPVLEDEVTVRVGGCSCYWSVTVDGATVESGPGDEANFLVEDGGGGPALAEIALADAGGDWMLIAPSDGDDPAPVPQGTTGSFSAAVPGTLASGVGAGYSGGDVTLTLSRNEADGVEGSAAGIVELAVHGEEDWIPVPISASFRVAAETVESAGPGTIASCSVGG